MMRKGPRNFQFLFEGTGLTPWGGLVLFRQFCKSLNLRYFLQHCVRWPSYSYRHYHPTDMFLVHVFAIVAGIGRIENTKSLLHNGLLPSLLGLTDFPHRDSLRTFLLRNDQNTLRNLQSARDRFRAYLFQHLGILYSATIDMDTTTIPTYGQQEGAALGYSPKLRHNNLSYAPILASESYGNISLGLELRSGNTPGTHNVWPFLQTMLHKLPVTIASSRTRCRLDAGFYDRAIIERLDEINVGYAIVARMTAPLRLRMLSARYREYARGWEAGEFSYTPVRWDRSHRFVAIRRPKKLEPQHRQQNLFTWRDHTYHRVLITNLDLTPESIYRFYCHRASQELLIREFKESLCLSQIPTRKFWANATYMEIILWAYDLVTAFQMLCLPKPIRHWNISSLRRELWWLPAEWVKRGNRNVLRLPKRYPRQEMFFGIQRATTTVKPLI